MFGFKIWKVKGHSMAPPIPQGSFVLVASFLKHLPIKAGQRLLLSHPEYGDIIKTVAVIDRNGLIWCKGENSNSISVEQLGPASKKQIIGRVIHIFKPMQYQQMVN